MRDRYVPKTPPKGVAEQIAAPEYVCDDVTGKYEGDDLLAARTARAEQNPAVRIALIETEQKEQGKRLHQIELATADIRGDQKAQNASLTAISATLDRMSAREHVRFATAADVDAAKQKDAITAKAERRQALLRVALYVVTGGLLGKILHSLGLL